MWSKCCLRYFEFNNKNYACNNNISKDLAVRWCFVQHVYINECIISVRLINIHFIIKCIVLALHTLNMRLTFDRPPPPGCHEEKSNNGFHQRETQKEDGSRRQQEKQKVEDVERQRKCWWWCCWGISRIQIEQHFRGENVSAVVCFDVVSIINNNNNNNVSYTNVAKLQNFL